VIQQLKCSMIRLDETFSWELVNASLRVSNCSNNSRNMV